MGDPYPAAGDGGDVAVERVLVAQRDDALIAARLAEAGGTAAAACGRLEGPAIDRACLQFAHQIARGERGAVFRVFRRGIAFAPDRHRDPGLALGQDQPGHDDRQKQLGDPVLGMDRGASLGSDQRGFQEGECDFLCASER